MFAELNSFDKISNLSQEKRREFFTRIEFFTKKVLCREKLYLIIRHLTQVEASDLLQIRWYQALFLYEKVQSKVYFRKSSTSSKLNICSLLFSIMHYVCERFVWVPHYFYFIYKHFTVNMSNQFIKKISNALFSIHSK